MVTPMMDFAGKAVSTLNQPSVVGSLPNNLQ
jgi:hypothetical protein